jgi:hypothetical protein
MLGDDLTPFFCTSEFAVAATLGAEAVVGVMDTGFDDATLGGFGVVGSSPIFTLAAASVQPHSEGMSLVVSAGNFAGTYKVGSARPNAAGLVALHLITHI